MLTLSDSQFTPYARRQAAMVIGAHIDALQITAEQLDDPTATRARIHGITWVADLLAIPLTDEAEVSE